LFGSVTSTDVATAMAAKGFEIDRRRLTLREPIKKLGEYDIPLRLHPDVTIPIKVKVVAEGADRARK
jgi:large subunit ribosomal protein L9